MSERRLLQAIVVLLAIQLAVQVVPPPFDDCFIAEGDIDCRGTWWLPEADYFDWLPWSIEIPRW